MIIDVSLACGEACFFCKANDQWHLGRNGQWMSCRTARSLMKSDEVWWSLMCQLTKRLPSTRPEIQQKFAHLPLGHPGSSNICALFPRESPQLFGWRASQLRYDPRRSRMLHKQYHIHLNIYIIRIYIHDINMLLSIYKYIYIYVRLLLYCQWRHQEMPRTWNLMTNFQHRNVQRMPREPRVV